MFRTIRQRPLAPPFISGSALFLCLAGLGLTACAPDPEPEPEPEPPSAESESVQQVQQEVAVAVTDSPLVGTEWRVEMIAGQAVIDRSGITIGFPKLGRVSGKGGCGRYFGTVLIDAGGMSVGRLAGKLMECPPAIMEQDRRFQQTLAKVARWEIGEAQLLRLLDAEGSELIRASRIERDAQGE